MNHYCSLTSPCCGPCREELRKAVDERNRQLNERTIQLKNLKEEIAEVKKRHTETNNEIIKSNVRYQKSLGEIQSVNQALVKEKEQLAKTLQEKESELMSCNAEKAILQQTLDTVVERIEKKIMSIQEAQPVKPAVSSKKALPPLPATPSFKTNDNKTTKSQPTVLEEPIVKKTSLLSLTPVVSPIPSPVTQRRIWTGEEDMDVDDEQGIVTADVVEPPPPEDPKITKQKEKEIKQILQSGLEKQKLPFDMPRPRRQCSPKVSYAEPSLRKKLRKGNVLLSLIKPGDDNTFDNNVVYVDASTQLQKISKGKSASAPTSPTRHHDKENVPTQEALFKRRVVNPSKQNPAMLNRLL